MLDPSSDPYAILTGVLADSGWPYDLAVVYAARLVGIADSGVPLPQWNPVNLPDGTPLLDPTSNVQALLTYAFIDGGWSPDQAALHAARAVKKLGPEQDFSSPLAPPQCYVSYTTMDYCENVHGQWVKKRRAIYLNGQCWDGPNGNDGLGHCYGMFPQCLNANESKRAHLTTQGGSNCTGVPLGACVRVSVNPPSFISCPDEVIACDCFLELSVIGPIDCNAIEITCCPSRNGCPGQCPFDDCN